MIRLYRIIHSLLFWVLIMAGVAVALIVALFCRPFSRHKLGPFFVISRIWAKYVVFLGGVRIEVAGLENIPKDKAMIYAVNHQSLADSPICVSVLPGNVRLLAKKDIFNAPLLGWYIKRAGYLPVDRNLPQTFYLLTEKIKEIIHTGESILIFPEGVRSWTGELGKFRHASLLPALISGAPVVPIAISGSRKIMPPPTWIVNPQRVKVNIGKPIYIRSEADYDQKLEEVREAIANMLEDKT